MMRVSNSMRAVAVAAVALAPGWAWAQSPSDSGGYAYAPHMMGWGEGWYGMIFGPLFMILMLTVVIAVAVFLVRGLGGSWQGVAPHHMPLGRTPLDIPRERFARGEIDKEEFNESHRVLGE